MPDSPNRKVDNPQMLDIDALIARIKTHGQNIPATILPAQCYYDAQLAAIERDRIFQNQWLCVGHVSDIPKPGDYLCDKLGNDPIFVMRQQDNSVQGFSNICQHRMACLLNGSGHTKTITCPYHGWTYDWQGRLRGAGFMAADFDKSSIKLPDIRTEIWQGWIYATLNPSLVSINVTLGELTPIVDAYGMEDYVSVIQQDFVWQSNWKLLCENFMESYHLPVAHNKTVGQWIGLDNCQFPTQSHDGFTWQSFTKSQDARYGVAHKDNERLHAIARTTSIMPCVFPSHMFVLAPDHLWYLSLRPMGPDQIAIRFGVALAPEVHIQHNQQWLDELLVFFDRVNAEDRALVEGIYQNLHAHHATNGPLSKLEANLSDFHRYLARVIA